MTNISQSQSDQGRARRWVRSGLGLVAAFAGAGLIALGGAGAASAQAPAHHADHVVHPDTCPTLIWCAVMN